MHVGVSASQIQIAKHALTNALCGVLDVEPSRITVVSAVSVVGSGRRMLLSSNSGSLCEMEVNVEAEDRQQARSVHVSLVYLLST